MENTTTRGEGIVADPLLFASLRSTMRHYLSGYLHQFLITYGNGLLPVPLAMEGMWNVLNIPCCSGDWVCDIAYQNPLIQLVGIDPDPRRITFAQAQATTQGITNATFLVGAMESLMPPDHYYDLLYLRFLSPVVRQDAWERVAASWWRLCRPGGFLMWTEMCMPVTNSRAFTDWCVLLKKLFEQEGLTSDITSRMPSLLDRARFQDIQHSLSTIDISSNTILHKHTYMHIWDILNFVHCKLLFSSVAEISVLDDLYEQMVQDILSDNFCGTWNFETYVATRMDKPS